MVVLAARSRAGHVGCGQALDPPDHCRQGPLFVAPLFYHTCSDQSQSASAPANHIHPLAFSDDAHCPLAQLLSAPQVNVLGSPKDAVKKMVEAGLPESSVPLWAGGSHEGQAISDIVQKYIDEGPHTWGLFVAL